MSLSFRKKLSYSALAAGILFGFGVAPAHAVVPSCSGVVTETGTNSWTVCTGYSGKARINVTCNAIWPFTPWTDQGAWVNISGSTVVSNSHVYCAATLTYVIEATA